MTATPRPWQVGFWDGSGLDAIVTVETDPKDRLPVKAVAAVMWGCSCCKGEADAEDLANAELIVRAVNAFDALLAVAKAAAQDGCCDTSGACEGSEEHNAVGHALDALDVAHPGWRDWAP